MHLIIRLKKSDTVRIPIHYNSLLQGAIYNSITPELANFLHDKGFPYEKRNFKLFTFSRIQGKCRFERSSGHLVFPTGAISFTVSSPLATFLSELGNIILFSKELVLGKEAMDVDGIETTCYTVDREKITLYTLSPVVVYSTLLKPTGGKYTCYYQPGDKEFTEQINSNLRKKYISLYRKEPPAAAVTLMPRGRIQQNILKYRDFVIKGYTCRFIVKGHQELLQLAVDAGIGAKNSQGFGCVRLS